MSTHDFSALYAQYPAIIDQMPIEFTSHEFILRLAQQHQDLYVSALYAYRSSLHDGKPAPFKAVHGQMARQLHQHANLVKDVHPSPNIFGQNDTCSLWHKK